MRVIAIEAVAFNNSLNNSLNKSKSPGQSHIARNPGDLQQKSPYFLQGLAEACLLLSPQVALGTTTLFIEIEKCNKLLSEENFLLRLNSLCQEFFAHCPPTHHQTNHYPITNGQIPYQIGVGNSPAQALLQARYNTLELDKLPVQSLPIFKSPFTLDLNVDDSLFLKLGITTLADLLELPQKELALRFPRPVVEAIYNLRTPPLYVWPWFQVESCVTESQCFESQCFESQLLEPLLFVVRPILERLCLRLKGRGQMMTLLQMQLCLEKNSLTKTPIREWTLSFAHGIYEVHKLLLILRERLAHDLQLEPPLFTSITEIQMTALETCPARQIQKDLFLKNQEEAEQYLDLVARLSNKLGSQNVFQTCPIEAYMPERAWSKVPAQSITNTMQIKNGEQRSQHTQKQSSRQTQTQTQRQERKQRDVLFPLRLIDPPIEVHCLNSLVFLGQKQFQTLEIKGPERLSGSWWLGDKERDYWQVHLANGEKWWLYRSGNKFWLHGIYD